MSRDHGYLIDDGKLCVMPSVGETFSDWARVTDDFPTRWESLLTSSGQQQKHVFGLQGEQ